jgi:hypothetical protein
MHTSCRSLACGLEKPSMYLLRFRRVDTMAEYLPSLQYIYMGRFIDRSARKQNKKLARQIGSILKSTNIHTQKYVEIHKHAHNTR